MDSKPPHLFPLTSVRFILAMWVLAYHQSFVYSTDQIARLPQPLFCFLRMAPIALGFFFVLSGFVLAYNYPLDKRWKSDARKRFAIARFSRIYPAYCLGLLLTLPFAAKALLNRSTVLHGIRLAVTAALNWTLLQSWTPWTALKWNPPGWSLSNDVFFYFCFPVIGIVLWRFSRRWALLGVGLLLCAAAAVPQMVLLAKVAHGWAHQEVWPGPTLVELWLTRFNPVARLPDFCAGIILARTYSILRERGHWLVGRGHWLYLPALVVEACAILQFQKLPPQPGYDGLLLPLDGCIILGFALGGGVLVRALSMRWMVFLGDASFAIYLLHTPIKWWMEALAKSRHTDALWSGGATTFYVCFVVAVSCIVYEYVEKPLNRRLRARLGARLDRTQDTAPKTPATGWRAASG